MDVAHKNIYQHSGGETLSGDFLHNLMSVRGTAQSIYSNAMHIFDTTKDKIAIKNTFLLSRRHPSLQS